ncbi:MAG: nitronate monooxygenase, partial [Eubacterium sp.]
ATRFIATKECDASQAYKQMMVDAHKEDIAIVKSPVGFPGRALKTKLIKRIESGRIVPEFCLNCLTPCRAADTPYCITQALISAVEGNAESGLFFCGAGVWKIRDITTVKAIMDECVGEAEKIMEG